jgi:starvation-inducible DNA-binding protein
MFARLARDNDTVIATLYETRSIADQLGQFGVVNFLEDRITAHEKHRWMLKSF